MPKSITQKDIDKVVIIQDGKAVCHSDKLAKMFGKRHKDILQMIRKKLGNPEDDNNVRQNKYFIESSYVDSRGRDYLRYDLTFEGFNLIALSLRGEKADEYKMWFIDSFVKMLNTIVEHKLISKINNDNPIWLQIRNDSKESRNKLTKAIQDYELPQRIAEGKGEYNFVSTRIMNYTQLIYKSLKITLPKGASPRDTLTPNMIIRLDIMEDKIADMIINFDGHYKDCYQEIKRSISL